MEILNKLTETIENNISFLNKTIRYSDVIVMDGNKNILLLQRSLMDSFEPGKWCLPGGKIDLGENSMDAAYRELIEETFIKTEDIKFIKNIRSTGASISYFLLNIIQPIEIQIRNKEHYGFCWCNISEIDKYDLLLNLSENIKELHL